MEVNLDKKITAVVCWYLQNFDLMLNVFQVGSETRLLYKNDFNASQAVFKIWHKFSNVQQEHKPDKRQHTLDVESE